MSLAKPGNDGSRVPFRRRRKLHFTLGGLLVFLILPMLYISWSERSWDFRDQAANGGAALVSDDPFGDNYGKFRRLEQGWNSQDQLWFYTTTQGSDLVPYDFFLSLEDIKGDGPFRSPANILRWRYLPQVASLSNPDALPVGFVRDRYKGRDYLGFSCSACHTGQLTYHGSAMRIDGGPALADMDSFMHELGEALALTGDIDAHHQCRSDRCRRFVQQVVALGHYADPQTVIDELQTFQRRIAAYNTINSSQTAYGYARLDAFGRIYNRVLEHLLRPRDLAALLPKIYEPDQLPAVNAALKDLLSDPPAAGQLHTVARALGLTIDPLQHPVIERALARLDAGQADQMRRKLFNEPSAPVSYPYLWDVPYSDYVQWNALAANATLGPVGRNAGEVIGVFGTLDWSVQQGFSLSALIGGQPFGTSHISFESSVNVHNLTRIENQLHKLMSPLWPQDLLGSFDEARVARGARLYEEFCVSCHSIVVRDDPARRLVAHVTGMDILGTDRTMASNSVGRTGYSGVLRNEYATTFSVGSILLDERAPAAALLTKSTLSVVATPYPEANPLSRVYHFLYDLGDAFFSNPIKPSLKAGHYEPDNPSSPYASLKSYKGRALNGIWATAPYLHNGSVPTLYDLLLPARQSSDPADAETRPDEFLVGSREFDPVKVGLRSAGYGGTTFRTADPGNSNAGHEYGTPRDPFANLAGKHPLTHEERLDLLEYLKTL